jgi:hypothetical protein
MAKVVGPLQSEEAHGAFGKAIIFQGNTAKAYAEPYNPESASQLEHRHFFADVTKITKALGATSRAVMVTNFGATWFQIIYGMAQRDDHDWYTDALTTYSGLDSAAKLQWEQNAPFDLTWFDAGETFYCLIRMIYKKIAYDGGDFGGLQLYTAYESEVAAAWWLGEESFMLAAQVRKTADQTVPTGVATRILYDTAMMVSAGMFDGSGSPGIVTITQPGLYWLKHQTMVDEPGTDNFLFQFVKNGGVVLASDEGDMPTNDIAKPFRFETICNLDADDTVECQFKQWTGGNKGLLASGSYYPCFWVVRLGAQV